MTTNDCEQCTSLSGFSMMEGTGKSIEGRHRKVDIKIMATFFCFLIERQSISYKEKILSSFFKK